MSILSLQDMLGRCPQIFPLRQLYSNGCFFAQATKYFQDEIVSFDKKYRVRFVSSVNIKINMHIIEF